MTPKVDISRASEEKAEGETEGEEVFITVSDALEYLFCPRFVFFMHCLGIPQREERR